MKTYKKRTWLCHVPAAQTCERQLKDVFHKVDNLEHGKAKVSACSTVRGRPTDSRAEISKRLRFDFLGLCIELVFRSLTGCVHDTCACKRQAWFGVQGCMCVARQGTLYMCTERWVRKSRNNRKESYLLSYLALIQARAPPPEAWCSWAYSQCMRFLG